jgi:hypothetical protein
VTANQMDLTADNKACASAFTDRFALAMRGLEELEREPQDVRTKIPEVIELYRNAISTPGVRLRARVLAPLESQIAWLLLRLGDVGAADACMARAEELWRREPPSREDRARELGTTLVRGQVLLAQNRVGEGLRALRSTLPQFLPLGLPLHLNPGMVGTLFLAGDVAGAFRLRASQPALWKGACPAYRWIDSIDDLASIAIPIEQAVVVTEAGHGDQLQHLQLHPLLAERAKRIRWYTRPELVPLLRRELPPPHSVAAFGEEWLPPTEPGTFGFRAAALPYILGLHTRAEPLPGALHRGPGMRRRREVITVGFSWKGDSRNFGDVVRSTSLLAWTPLFTLPGVRWVCLQPDRTPEEEALLKLAPSVVVPPRPKHFGTTADHVRACDLLVTVNSSLAHLGGVLGARTWLLLNPMELDGQWGVEGQRALWYDSVWIWRHRIPGDWTEALGRVRRALSTGVAQLLGPQASTAEVGC